MSIAKSKPENGTKRMTPPFLFQPLFLVEWMNEVTVTFILSSGKGVCQQSERFATCHILSGKKD